MAFKHTPRKMFIADDVASDQIHFNDAESENVLLTQQKNLEDSEAHITKIDSK